MTKRLVLFIGFLCVLAFVFGLSTYKDEFKKEDVLNREYLTAKIQKIEAEKKALAERLAKAEAGIIEEPVEEKIVIDMNDPDIKMAVEVYTANCVSCHGEQGQGNEEMKGPLIAAQHDWYVIDHMTQLKNGKRPISGEAAAAHAKITDEEIVVLAKYIKLLRLE